MVGNAPVIAVQFATRPIANGAEVPSLKRCIWANASVTNSIFGHFAKAVPLIIFLFFGGTYFAFFGPVHDTDRTAGQVMRQNTV